MAGATGVPESTTSTTEQLDGMQPHSGDFPPRAKVVVHGLSGAIELNGLAGSVVGRQGDRYKVWLLGHGSKALRPSNLVIDPFPARTRVVVQNLISAVHLNESVGVVLFRRANGRYEVSLGVHGRKALKAGNLRRAEHWQAESTPISVAVLAPGAGTRSNAAVYESIRKDAANFELAVRGAAGSGYDRYPLGWPGGAEAPNLESFAEEQLMDGIVEQADCLVFGSRGGQVVLPVFWRERGADVPPAVVINGGCAMTGPSPAHWPAGAVTLLLLGGRDDFRGTQTEEQYVALTQSQVPPENSTTAVLYIREMGHMPPTQLLASVLRRATPTLQCWRSMKLQREDGDGLPHAPLSDFEALANELALKGWSGQLSFTASPGRWSDLSIRMMDASPTSSVPASVAATPVPTSAAKTPTARFGATSPTSQRIPALMLGSRVEAFYEGRWYAGVISGMPEDDPKGQGRWAVHCDVDPEGVIAFVNDVRPAPTAPHSSAVGHAADRRGSFSDSRNPFCMKSEASNGNAGPRPASTGTPDSVVDGAGNDNVSEQSCYGVGSRVRALFEGNWYPGTVLALPAEDPGGYGRWTVQCDVDKKGVATYAQHVRAAAASA